jgi:translation initiation factor 3 subunit J
LISHYDTPQSDWEASSEEEEVPAVVAPAAPPKKKGTLKAKLAQKEAEKAARKAYGEDEDGYDSDAVLDPRARAKLDKEKELNSDLNNAADLLGAAALGGKSTTLKQGFKLTYCHLFRDFFI